LKPIKRKEYRELIDELGLTQASIAQLLDIAERTSRRYALLAPIAIKVHAYAACTCEPGGAAVITAVN
jgi:hypothetical protein